MSPVPTLRILVLLLTGQFLFLSASYPSCGNLSVGHLGIAGVPWFLGVLLFLLSKNKLAGEPASSADCWTSFGCVALMTILTGDTLATYLWGGHDPLFEARTFTPVSR